MNKLTAVFLVASSLTLGCSSHSETVGDGKLKTENRPITDFSSLIISGEYQVKWLSGQPALNIITDQNLLPQITSTVNGNALTITGEKNISPTDGIIITVSSASLNDIHISGASSLSANKLSGTDLKLEAGDTSSINVDGAVTNVEAVLEGASILDAKALKTQSFKVSMKGTANAEVNVSEKLIANISQVATMIYTGTPKLVEKNISGLGKMESK